MPLSPLPVPCARSANLPGPALHFHLAIANDPSPSKSMMYEDIEFQYTPRLDANRDAELLRILPDYLTEEITFSRVNAAKFYSRVVDALTRKV